MLVLSRKVGEKILIGDNIQVMITKIKKDSIHLGVIAPREMPIDREEIRNVKNISQSN